MDKKRYHIPETLQERTRLRSLIKDFISDSDLVPPLALDTLYRLSADLINREALPETLQEWMMVEMHNCAWLPVFATIPHERRILLLPKCLSNSSCCKAEMDELGLLCHRCGGCRILNLEDRAAELGMMSIVAEGFTSVIGLIKAGAVDAVIGVSCLDSLEKAFPLLVNNAVPGLAVPLNRDGCHDTDVDADHLISFMEAKEAEEYRQLDYDGLMTKVKSWFGCDSLEKNLGKPSDQTSRIAFDWLAGDGKRLRPYIFAATYSALASTDRFDDDVVRAAIAIESFHKASLVHDDIEDNDMLRYGKPTIYKEYGSSIAINVGDMLLGEGYRQLGRCRKNALTSVIAEAHIALCKGQGMELEWCSDPKPVTLDHVLDIFRLKTSPAFEVALAMGVLCADADENLLEPLHRYSEALGVAYQLYDDLDDFSEEGHVEIRPSAVFAVLCRLEGRMVASLEGPYLTQALDEVRALAESYRKKAVEAVEQIRNVELKRLLFRVTAKVLK